jgi:Putative beta-barrel porin-2, OmpL-like. bbp2
MNKFGICAGLSGLAVALSVGSAAADPLPTPALSGPIVGNGTPITFDTGIIGNIDVGGVVSGLALFQTNHTSSPGDHQDLVDLSNGQIFVQKTDGWVQFYLQVGEYSLPSLGAPYARATSNTSATFSAVPEGYLKFVPTDNFNIEIGKLPTLIGAEYTFTFENMNIERGLLWNEEPAISRGVQANYTAGPVAVSVSWNDGAYSNRYDWVSGSVAYTISPSDSVTAVGGGYLGKDAFLSAVNSESVYNLIWTHTSGPWTITPYAQYANIHAFGFYPETSTWGGAVLANYSFDPHWNLSGRVEYVDQSEGYDPLLYGHKSSAWSFTVTPTYQYKIWFARAEASYVTASDIYPFFSSLGSPGPGFGTSGTKSDQFRVLFETGVLF